MGSISVSTPDNKENYYFTVYCIFLSKESYGFKNDHYYIGQHYTNNINDNYMGSGVILRKLYNKYGKTHAKKTILSVSKTLAECNESEKYFIKEYHKKYGRCVLNIQDGGRNNASFNIPEEVHLKNIEGLKAYWLNPDNKDKILLRNKRIAERMKGNKNGEGTVHHHSDETRKKISEHVKATNQSRIPKLSEIGKKTLFVYRNNGQLQEYKSVKYSWKLLGFTSESVCQRFIRYCTKLLENNNLNTFNFKYGKLFIAYRKFDVNIVQNIFNKAIF